VKTILTAALLALAATTAGAADEKSCLTGCVPGLPQGGSGATFAERHDLSVEAIIAKWRLEEQFCLRTAECLAGPQPALGGESLPRHGENGICSRVWALP
jgi:hypothetical protein